MSDLTDWENIPPPKRDTACFSDRQWFVGSHAFSTQKDAEVAIRLAGEVSLLARKELWQKLHDTIDGCYP